LDGSWQPNKSCRIDAANTSRKNNHIGGRTRHQDALESFAFQPLLRREALAADSLHIVSAISSSFSLPKLDSIDNESGGVLFHDYHSMRLPCA